MRITIKPGVSLEAAIRQAMATSEATNEPTTFEYLGLRVVVDRDSDPAAVAAHYDAELERRLARNGGHFSDWAGGDIA